VCLIVCVITETRKGALCSSWEPTITMMVNEEVENVRNPCSRVRTPGGCAAGNASVFRLVTCAPGHSHPQYNLPVLRLSDAHAKSISAFIIIIFPFVLNLEHRSPFRGFCDRTHTDTR
jgi:hypothetical protein